MRALGFHPGAEEEFAEAVEYYEKAVAGLGSDFFDEVWDALWLILKQPGIYPMKWGKYGKCVLRRFPFTIFFKDSPEQVFIVAIAHTSRESGYWLNRK